MSAIAPDVLIVGGGPAGAATALLLARRGLDVTVLDKAAFPRDKPCAEYLSPGVVEVLARLGVLEAIRAADAAWPLGMRIQTPRRGFLVSYAGESAAFAGRRTALGIRRPLLDQILLDAARSQGAHVHERCRARGAIIDGGRVVGVQVDGPSGTESLRARFVVAADGHHSAIARSLGLDQPVRWPRRLGLIAHYAGVGRIREVGEMHVGAGAYCGLAPVGRDLVSVGLVMPVGEKPAGEPVGRYFERRLAALPAVSETLRGAHRLTAIRGVGPLARRVRRVAGPGYLLVGDAAGFLDPFTGEGVYRALRGAELAASAIADALGRTEVEPVGYAPARRATFAAKERLCWLIQLFLSAPRLFDYAIGHLTERPKLGMRLSGILGDYEPARSALGPGFLFSLLRP